MPRHYNTLRCVGIPSLFDFIEQFRRFGRASMSLTSRWTCSPILSPVDISLGDGPSHPLLPLGLTCPQHLNKITLMFGFFTIRKRIGISIFGQKDAIRIGDRVDNTVNSGMSNADIRRNPYLLPRHCMWIVTDLKSLSFWQKKTLEPFSYSRKHSRCTVEIWSSKEGKFSPSSDITGAKVSTSFNQGALWDFINSTKVRIRVLLAKYLILCPRGPTIWTVSRLMAIASHIRQFRIHVWSAIRSLHVHSRRPPRSHNVCTSTGCCSTHIPLTAKITTLGHRQFKNLIGAKVDWISKRT